MITKKARALMWLSVTLLIVSAVCTQGQTPKPGTTWTYQLLPESQIIDSCPACGRPDIILPLRGSFQLRLIDEGPLILTFAVENVSFTAGYAGGPNYKLTGNGLYRLGGEVAFLQDLSLDLYVDSGAGKSLCDFTNVTHNLTRMWPMIQAALGQTNGTLTQEFHLDLFAAPFNEIWFSTASSLTAGIWQPPTNLVSAGDLLSSAGRIIRRNGDLTKKLGIPPPVPDLGLKDVDILSGGEVAFSIEQAVFSETLGPLSPGGLLTDRGRILATNHNLIEAFLPQPGTADVGLAAIQVLEQGEIYFSVQTNFFSEALGRTIRPGDLLSSHGLVVRTQESLLERFSPKDPAADVSLRSVYVWPSGEIWFSTENGFVSTNNSFYGRGDLLSDQGYVVYRNLDLVAVFQPLEDLADFGLDALFIVTDVTPPPLAPKCVEARIPFGTSDWYMRFESSGRVAQLERSINPQGPWIPIGGVTLDLEFIDPGVVTNLSTAFYRLHSW